MNLKLLISTLSCTFLFLGTTELQAQYRRNCSTMDHLERQIEANPEVEYRMRDVEIRTAENVRSARADILGEVVIPVVVHVVYNNESQNISEEQIQSQMRVLNEDFGRTNPDRFNTPSYFGSVAASANVSFALATEDPYGNPTTGITRHRTNQRQFSPANNGVKYGAMGGVDAWNTKAYLNIWVCNLGAGMLGYAQFPGGGANETDGVVIGYKFFGTMGTAVSPFDRGRTTTHEVGHWLNLKHIWGDGPCDVDDQVDDTPRVDDAHYGCLSSATACNGRQAMVSNFMDYTDDACMNLFTYGQAERMRSLFAPGGFRRQLLYSDGLNQSAPVTVAMPPELLNATEVEASSARLSWSPVKGATEYRARFRAVGDTDWAMRSFSRTFVNATRLETCTSYEFQIESVVDGKESGFSESKMFKTSGCAASDPIGVNTSNTTDVSSVDFPTNLYVSNEFGTQATLNWDQVAGATSYKIQYKEAGSRKVYAKTLEETEVNVYGLVVGTRYFFRVRANFGNDYGEYSEVSSFIASSGSSARMVAKSAPADYFQIRFPQQRKQAEVRFDLGSPATLTLDVLDENSNPLIAYNPFELAPGSPIELDFNELRPGNYLLQIKDEDGFTYVRPFQIR